MFDAGAVDKLDMGADHRAVQALANYVHGVQASLGKVRGPAERIAGNAAFPTTLKMMAREIERRSTWKGGGGILVSEQEDGRFVHVPPKLRTVLLDVITIGGYYRIVEDPGPPVVYDYPTVNDWFGERNAILPYGVGIAEGLTPDQVNAAEWTWDTPGDDVHFAVAAVLHGTRHMIPGHDIEGEWSNPAVPGSIILARSAGNEAGGSITLKLTVTDVGYLGWG